MLDLLMFHWAVLLSRNPGDVSLRLDHLIQSALGMEPGGTLGEDEDDDEDGGQRKQGSHNGGGPPFGERHTNQGQDGSGYSLVDALVRY